jgi:2-keto-4-pentenoate hydratase/2-oxohepta-3-ene-1,7-dioic acid hydratase in catechol pathway
VRYVRIEVDGSARVGLLVVESPQGASPEETVAAAYEPASVRLFPAGTDLLVAAVARQEPAADAPSVPLTGARLLAPVQPASFRDFVAFEQHVQGMTRGAAEPMAAWYQQPTYLYGSPHAVVGPDEPVAAPPDSEALDFELEVGVVIGRDGRDLTPEEAAEHIAGYVIVNDWSARDIQRHEMKGGLGPAKSKDFATTVGPWLVTPDELEPARVADRLDLTMTVHINGEVFGQDSLAHMGWSFEQLVSYASRSAWVRAGDLIASGTCHGGSLAEAWGRAGKQEPRPLLPGDVVTMTVDRLGTLASPVIAAAPERAPVPPATPLAQLQAATGAHA